MKTGANLQIPERSHHASANLPGGDAFLVYGGKRQTDIFSDVSVCNATTYEWRRYSVRVAKDEGDAESEADDETDDDGVAHRWS